MLSLVNPHLRKAHLIDPQSYVTALGKDMERWRFTDREQAEEFGSRLECVRTFRQAIQDGRWSSHLVVVADTGLRETVPTYMASPHFFDEVYRQSPPAPDIIHLYYDPNAGLVAREHFARYWQQIMECGKTTRGWTDLNECRMKGLNSEATAEYNV